MTTPAQQPTTTATVADLLDLIYNELSDGPIEANILYTRLNDLTNIPRHHIAFTITNEIAHGRLTFDGDCHIGLPTQP